MFIIVALEWGLSLGTDIFPYHFYASPIIQEPVVHVSSFYYLGHILYYIIFTKIINIIITK
jgi:hypothetical protein